MSTRDDWQPIETAPKDGTIIDLWVRYLSVDQDSGTVASYAERTANCFWYDNKDFGGTKSGWKTETFDEADKGGKATHWMPPPEPPVTP